MFGYFPVIFTSGVAGYVFVIVRSVYKSNEPMSNGSPIARFR